jgi:hypothetical protein
MVLYVCFLFVNDGDDGSSEVIMAIKIFELTFAKLASAAE